MDGSMPRRLMRLISIVAQLLAAAPACASAVRHLDQMTTTGEGPVHVIVELDLEPLGRYRGGVAGLAATSARMTHSRRLEINSPAALAYRAHARQRLADAESAIRRAAPDARVSHLYDVVLGGLAVTLPAKDLGALRALPGVRAVHPDEMVQLDTNTTPSLIGARRAWREMGGSTEAGQDVVVGLLDTGIWPEHPSFSDPDPSGRPYPPPPTHWNGGAGPVCEQPADASAPLPCNNKLVGARTFLDGYKARVPIGAGDFDSPRDSNGHGTHTASTAAGNHGVHARVLGRELGAISGIAPRARVAMYRVCGPAGCTASDEIAAIQQAVLDGVDVLNLSISGGRDPYADPVELALLDAYEAGVFVAAAAGNSGVPNTVGHRGPWVTTVGATTTARVFTDTLTLAAGRDQLRLKGTSVTPGAPESPLLVAADLDDPLCRRLGPGDAAGTIVACESGGNPLREKARVVRDAGARGMIVYNPVLSGTGSLSYVLPATHIEEAETAQFFAFLTGRGAATARLSRGKATPTRRDVIALFSSRGGAESPIGIGKPDLVAPGEQILAGYTPEPLTGITGELFYVDQGTSMSAPHVAGAAALLRQLHPDWTPGQVKSALMTTARSKGLLKEDGRTPADPFDVGSGRIDLRRAFDPGITFDVPAPDYSTFGDALHRTNYPSIFLGGMPGALTVRRTARSVLDASSSWSVRAVTPDDVDVAVPAELVVPGNGEAAFDVTVDARDVPIDGVRHATIELRSGHRLAHLPVTLIRRAAPILLDTRCTPDTVTRGGAPTECTATVENPTALDAQVNIVDVLPSQLSLLPASVSGATTAGNVLRFEGTLAAAGGAVKLSDVPPNEFFYPLARFGVPPIPNVGDDGLIEIGTSPFLFGEFTYSSICMAADGYAVLGRCNGQGGAHAPPQTFPDPTPPNDVLAPFWTDLDPSAGGTLRVAQIDGTLVLEWQDVPARSGGGAYSFQILVDGINDTIRFAYWRVDGPGDPTGLRVGAENAMGDAGANHDALPTARSGLLVTQQPGPGGKHTISFQAQGIVPGHWTNAVEMTSNAFEGTSIVTTDGSVAR